MGCPCANRRVYSLHLNADGMVFLCFHLNGMFLGRKTLEQTITFLRALWQTNNSIKM